MTEEKRVAVVTGGDRGIGRGITDQLLKDGYCVVIANRNEEAGKKAVEELNAQGYEGKVVSVAGDASKKESHERFVQKAVDTFGRLDTYVNNAGIAQIKLLNSASRTMATRFARSSTPPVLPATSPLTCWVPTPHPSLPFVA